MSALSVLKRASMLSEGGGDAGSGWGEVVTGGFCWSVGISCEVGSFKEKPLEKVEEIGKLLREGERKQGFVLGCNFESLRVIEKAPVKPVYL